MTSLNLPTSAIPAGFSQSVRGLGLARRSPFPSWMLIFPAGILCCIVGMIEDAPAIPVFACLLFALGFLVLSLDRQDNPDRSFLYALFAWGFLLRVAYAIFLYYWLIYTRGEPFLGGGDDLEYGFMGEDMLLQLRNEGLSDINRMRHPGYPIVLAGLRFLTQYVGGYHGFISRIVSVCIGALIAPYIFILARNVWDRRIARIAGLLVMLYPGLIFYAAAQLRDIIIVFLFVFAQAQLSRFVTYGRNSGIVLALCTLPAMLYLRVEYTYLVLMIVAICLGACLLFQAGTDRKQRWLKFAMLLVGFVFISIAIKFSSGRTTPHMISEDSYAMNTLEEGYVSGKIIRQREHSLSAGTASSLGTAILSRMPWGISFIALPVIVFIMPYPPWAGFIATEPLSIVRFINAATWTILLPLVMYGLLAGWRHHYPKKLLILVPMVLILIASGTGGFSNERYKLGAIPFALIFCALSLSMAIGHRKKWVGMFYFVVQGGMLVAYFTAKTLVSGW